MENVQALINALGAVHAANEMVGGLDEVVEPLQEALDKATKQAIEDATSDAGV